jgi:hypothetical protein
VNDRVVQERRQRQSFPRTPFIGNYALKGA